MKKLIKTLFNTPVQALHLQSASVAAAIAAMVMLLFPITVLATGNDEPADAKPAAPASRVVISDYYIVGDGLVSGTQSTLVIVMKNTSETDNVSSVLVTGWIETGAPVEFVGANQAYVPHILPGREATVEFEYSTKNVDLSSIDGISAGFTILYSDESSGTERTNNVSLRLPVSSGDDSVFDEADMRWPEPKPSAMDAFLYAKYMQTIYVAGIILCCVCVVILLFNKARAANLMR